MNRTCVNTRRAPAARPHIAVMCLLATLLVVSPAAAQTAASLQGTVHDPSGSVLPGVMVTITDLATSVSRATTTDAGGSYSLAQTPPGSYRVHVALDGFAPRTYDAVTLPVATPVTLNIVLEVGGITQDVTVSAAETSRINAVDATAGQAFTRRDIQELPFLARNPINLLTLQPGVVSSGNGDADQLFFGAAPRGLDDRDGVVNGTRANQANITIDGVDANDWETQAGFASALPLSLDALQEFRVITSGATATAGVAAGAQVALVTRSGGNTASGNLRWTLRDDAWAANAFFNKVTSPAVPKPALERTLGGGSFGGPLKRNRLFFFGDVDVRRDANETTVARTVPGDALRQGTMRYRTTNGAVATLTPADIEALDPAGLGVNPAALRYFALYPAGNDPSSAPESGLNFSTLRFNAPIRANNEIYTLRLDANLDTNGRHQLSVRGITGDLRSDVEPAAFPGLQPSAQLVNHSRGVATTWNGQLGRGLHTVRHGWTRQDVATTGAGGTSFRIAPLAPFAQGGNAAGLLRGSSRVTDTHQVAGDSTWTAGGHTLQAGASLRLVRNARTSASTAFPAYESGTFYCTGTCRDAYAALVADGNPANDPADPAAFSDAFTALLAPIARATATFQADPATAAYLPAGSLQSRQFAEDGIELYLQDTWRPRADLTIGVGLRYSYYTPVWETNGQMVRPTVSVSQWWADRVAGMSRGVPSDASPLLSWAPAGKANDSLGWYGPDRNNIAPRGSIVWSPGFEHGMGRVLFGRQGQGVLRAGAGLYYHRIGSALAATTDRIGSPGTASGFASGQGQLSLATAPRLAGTCTADGCDGLPDLSQYFQAPSAATFPFTPPATFSGFGFLVDDSIKTPSSTNLTLSYQRELPARLTMDVSYVGTRGHDLLLKKDYAQFLGGMTDRASGQTLWGAQTLAAQLLGADPAQPATPLGSVGPIPFVENLMPNLPAYLAGRLNDAAYASLSASQAFSLFMSRNGPNWARALSTLDVPTGPGSPWNTTIDPEQNGFVLFQPQYQWLPTWTGGGRSKYDSLQLSLRRQTTGTAFGINYSFAVSRDLGSAAENAAEGAAVVGGSLGNSGQLVNSFEPELNWAYSDFDLRHNLNAYATVPLPFGRSARPAIDAIIGGWSVSTVVRWRSGFPLTTANGNPRATNYILSGFATVAGEVETDIQQNGTNGRPNLFADPAAVRAQLQQTAPGDVGSRNVIRGPGLSTVDLALLKRLPLPWRGHRLEARLSAYNAFNRANFWVDPISNNTGFFATAATYGAITATAGPRGGAREVELALRYEF